MSPTSEPRSPHWLLIAIGFCVLWVVLLSIFGPGPSAPRLDSGGSGQPADFAWKMLDLQDRPASLAAYRGKTVFLNIWATWCPPCIAEMPSIARLAEEPRLKDRSIAFVCVSVDDTTDIVRSFLQGRSWKMDFFRSQDLPGVFQTAGIPATFIIGPDGRIAASEVGSASWDGPETIALLEKLSAEGARLPEKKLD